MVIDCREGVEGGYFCETQKLENCGLMSGDGPTLWEGAVVSGMKQTMEFVDLRKLGV